MSKLIGILLFIISLGVFYLVMQLQNAISFIVFLVLFFLGFFLIFRPTIPKLENLRREKDVSQMVFGVLPTTPKWVGLSGPLKLMHKSFIPKLENLRREMDVSQVVFGVLLRYTPTARGMMATYYYDYYYDLQKKQNPKLSESRLAHDTVFLLLSNELTFFQPPAPELQIPELAMSQEEAFEISKTITPLTELESFMQRRTRKIIANLAKSGNKNALIIKEMDDILRVKHFKN